MQNGDGRMKILILSCNTGEGHNSAGWAVKEYLELQGHQVVMEDASERSADIDSCGRSLCGNREAFSVVIWSGLPAGRLGFFR